MGHEKDCGCDTKGVSDVHDSDVRLQVVELLKGTCLACVVHLLSSEACLLGLFLGKDIVPSQRSVSATLSQTNLTAHSGCTFRLDIPHSNNRLLCIPC